MRKGFIKTIMLLAGLSIGFSPNAFAIVERDPTEYSNNPSLLLSDANQLKQEGDFERAAKFYATYGALTNKSMDSEIRACQLPDWIDKSMMKIVPAGNSSVLIVFDNLYETTLWDDTYDNGVTLEGLSPVWDIIIGPSEYDAMKNSGLYMPNVGLFGGRTLTTQNLRGTGDGVANHYQPVSKITCKGKVYRSEGKSELNGGYIVVKEINSGGTYRKKNDELNKLDPAIYFYPVVKLQNRNGNWTQISLSNQQ